MTLIARTLRDFFSRRRDLPVVSAYLFGSEAEARSHRESDVDVAVLLDWERCPTRRARFDTRLHLGSELIAVLHRNEVDVVVLNDAPPTLGRRIVQEGERVFRGDPEADHAFVRDVQLRAADLDPFLLRARKRLLESLER